MPNAMSHRADSGCIYLCANASNASSAPKKVSIGHSKATTPIHATIERITEPKTATVKYSFSCPLSLPPRFVLMLTTDLFIAIISLCMTCFALGYTVGSKSNDQTQK